MPSHPAQNNEIIRLDGNLGPWTVDLPQGEHGDRISIGTLADALVDLTLNAAVGDQIRTYDGTSLVTQIATEMRQEMWTLVYYGDGNEWFIVSTSLFRNLSNPILGT